MKKICFITFPFATPVGIKIKRQILPLLFIPIGQLIVSLILLRSEICCWQRQGIVWRGTLYPLEQLRVGQRVKF